MHRFISGLSYSIPNMHVLLLCSYHKSYFILPQYLFYTLQICRKKNTKIDAFNFEIVESIFSVVHSCYLTGSCFLRILVTVYITTQGSALPMCCHCNRGRDINTQTQSTVRHCCVGREVKFSQHTASVWLLCVTLNSSLDECDIHVHKTKRNG